MNRLDFFIRRLSAQRACLTFAAELIADIEGPIFEIGLGKGRTYDFLRDVIPDREIFAFDRNVGSYPDCTPDMDHIVLGDFRETLLTVSDQTRGAVALAHCDFGSENRERDDALALWLGPAIDRVMAPNGVVATDREMKMESWRSVDLPPEVEDGAYFLYRVPAMEAA
jgi:hypothetical protein